MSGLGESSSTLSLPPPLIFRETTCVLLLTLLLKTENPSVRLPIMGVSRPLCGTCASFLRNSFAASGANYVILDLLVPGTHTAYSTCRMPAGAKQAVIESVAKDLKAEIRDVLGDWRVEAFFRTLARSADGQLPPSPD